MDEAGSDCLVKAEAGKKGEEEAHCVSYTFLLERGVSSAESFSDIPAYVLSRLNLTVEKSCSKDSATESFPSSRFGMMSQPSTADRGAEKLMSCAQGSRVKTLAAQTQPGKESADRKVVCGGISRAWLAKLAPDSRSWKIPQTYLFEELEPSSLIWPRWGAMLNGECFPLPMLAHATSAKGFGYFPTPTKADSKNIGRNNSYQENLHKITNLPLNPEFSEELMLWPIGITDLQPLAMDKFRRWLRSHGGSFR